jgi:endonuclease YncB( thermonuclease family)
MLKLLFAAALALAVQFAHAETVTGRVVGVHDGDTITVLDAGNRQTKVRLAQIDAPELRQDFGQASKDALSGLVFGKTVAVEVETTDKYGRTVGKVLVGGQDANLAQVRAGMAWAYRQYLHDQAYLDAEAQAKAAKAGLWSRPDATPPWEYRYGGKMSGQPSQASALVPPLAGASCGGKRYCGQMSDCAEATHYLRDCGLTKLDRDGDGTPCEALCKR